MDRKDRSGSSVPLGSGLDSFGHQDECTDAIARLASLRSAYEYYE